MLTIVTKRLDASYANTANTIVIFLNKWIEKKDQKSYS
jgi:hypothetical protein